MGTCKIEIKSTRIRLKHGVQTMLQYVRSFSLSIKESVKALTNWSAFYYTSNQARWYPPPESALKLNELRFPKPADPKPLEDDKKVLMREWASLNGAVVRQRSVRQETTMAKAGTLPEGSYEIEMVPNTVNDSDPGENDEEEPVPNTANGSDPETIDEEILQYDNDDESDIKNMATVPSRTSIQNLQDFQTAEVGKETSFLLGGRSRYGRTVRFNNRFA